MSKDNVVLARNIQQAPQCPVSSQTVAFSHYNNLSAQLPIDLKTGKIIEGGIIEQANQCFENIQAILENIHHTMNDIVRVTIFVKNIKDLDEVNTVFQKFFTTYLPSRTTLAVDDLPMKALVQIEVLVSNGEGTIPDAPQAGDLIKYLMRQRIIYPVKQWRSRITIIFRHNYRFIQKQGV